MQAKDEDNFATLVTSVYAFYRQDVSDFAINVWWEACKQFDFEAVKGAFNRHAVNPDNGQFMPKLADVVKLLQGSSLDGALVAWSKVDKAIRQVGTYQTVAFDDPIIHAAIQDMGGWVELGRKDENEWPFIAKEFQNRYRGYRTQGGASEFPRLLVGIAEAQNKQNGLPTQPPVLIGSAQGARLVIAAGSDRPALSFTRMDVAETSQLIEAPRSAA